MITAMIDKTVTIMVTILVTMNFHYKKDTVIN